uniref:SCP domain-containing protein n=1 Tax=Trichobilharzia regenti TaxID=157069 RepID=A0AA85IXM5_TRIRE|nr:unnamed protein product [Trichobilharzia regenti]
MQLFQWFILVSICLINSYANANRDWTIEDSELLALHNAYRQGVKYGKVQNQPPAMDIPNLMWSYELVNISKSWATTCQPYPSKITMSGDGEAGWISVGQNVAAVPNVRDAVALWFNEYSNYDFEANKCKGNRKCANYKQLVFSETTQVGCAYKRCDNFKAPNDIVVVCSYGPGGEYFSRRPYTASIDPQDEEDVFYEF